MSRAKEPVEEENTDRQKGGFRSQWRRVSRKMEC